MVDITRDVADGDISLFVQAPEPFSLDQRPPTRYRVLYTAPDQSEAAAGRIAGLTSGQRAYEERRAPKSRQDVGRVGSRRNITSIPSDRIAAFVHACDAFDAGLPTLPGMIKAVTDAADGDHTSDDVPEDKTWLAVESLDEWARKRDICRKAILRMMSGK